MSKPKRNKGESVPTPSGTQVQVWQPLSKPDNLPSEAICLTPGTQVPVMGKDGKQKTGKDGKPLFRTISGLQVRLPKVVKVMAENGLTEQQAKDRIGAIAKAIKPSVSGRVNQAMASDSYGIRSYTESKAGAVSVSLYPVNVSDKAAAIAAETGLSIEEVYKRIPELKPKEALTVNA